MSWPSYPGQRSLKVIEPDTDRSTIYDFLLTFHSNQRFSYRFRDIRRFQLNIAKFSHLNVFCAPAEGIPLGCATGPRKTDVYNTSTWQTDRQTDRRTGRRTDTGRQRQRLCVASRGKNDKFDCSNYRGISMLRHCNTVFSWSIVQRISIGVIEWVAS